ncbi:MAG: ATP-binding protein, partial [Nitrosomonas sp.]|nr:ATP-binding protein [Nitrosomonas sp.]
MKINKISSVGTVAVRKIEINIKSPIALICGSNRAGKSSLRDGIYHAFTGENPHDILKKNYGLLVNRDTGNNIGYTYVDYNNEQRACITLPNGTHELTEQLHSALPYVLNPSLFGSLSSDDRRRLLFDLGNLRSDGAEVSKKLLKSGCSEGDVDEVLPYLKSSFENAHKYAMGKIKEARANWKATTGEAYGDKKAVDWKAPKPEVDMDSAIAVTNTITQLDEEIEETSQKLGAYVATFNGAKARNSEIVRLRESAEMIDRIEAKLKKDRQEVIVWEVKVNDARLFAQG